MEKCTKTIYNCAPFQINLSADVEFDVCMKVPPDMEYCIYTSSI